MTPIDDIKRGDFIAVTKGPRQRSCGFFGFGEEPEEMAYDGMPIEVVEISLPFICGLLPDGRRGAFDVRVFQFQRVTKRYAESWQARTEPASQRRRRMKLPKGDADPRRCVRCGSMMVQRLMMKSGTGENRWNYWCDGCASDGGPVGRKA